MTFLNCLPDRRLSAIDVGHSKIPMPGIDQARRGWLTRSDVINTRSPADLRKLLKR
jgi:hypothetical protein